MTLFKKTNFSKTQLGIRPEHQLIKQHGDVSRESKVFVVEKFPYSEIQDNTIGKNIMPIDMLRLKLSFFGALKFDPRSDKWLRICMFQGAPLPHELKNYDEQWVYNS